MKNKEITIYELLGFMKDNRAPKGIIYKEEYFTYSENRKDYCGENSDLFINAFIGDILSDKVKIILDEENDEFEDIEEFKIDGIYYYDHNDTMKKINQLIRNQKKIIERLKKDE